MLWAISVATAALGWSLALRRRAAISDCP